MDTFNLEFHPTLPAQPLDVANIQISGGVSNCDQITKPEIMDVFKKLLESMNPFKLIDIPDDSMIRFEMVYTREQCGACQDEHRFLVEWNYKYNSTLAFESEPQLMELNDGDQYFVFGHSRCVEAVLYKVQKVE